MIAEDKRQIILDEGVPVDVYDYTGSLLGSTTALIGKATKQAMTEISLEYHRKAHFVPDFDIPNGLIVHNKITNEKYLAVANMVESYGNEVIAKISRLVESNALVTIKGFSETADENGDIFRGEVDKATNLPVHVLPVTAELKQYQPGLHSDAEYVIFCPEMDLDLLDMVDITKGTKKIPVKIVYVDILSFEGVVLINVCSETRV